MERVLYEKNQHFDLWSERATQSTHRDRFCSSPYWGVPLCRAFQPEGKLHLYQSSDKSDLAVFYERQVEGGELLLPPDGMWLLGSPILSKKALPFFKELLRFWMANPPQSGLRQILISGVYPETELLNSEFWVKLGGWEIDSSARMVASLKGGLDGFLSRRSKNFRSRLRRMVKAAAGQGFEVEMLPKQADSSVCERVLQRIFSLEKKSWKGIARRGIDSGGMKEFYEQMIPLLAADNRLRGLFLTRDGEDFAYLFGAYFGDYFRGLQFSFRDTEDIGLGNVCQYHMINALVEEGCQDYDLGQGMDYKKRWAESHITSRSFVFQMH